MVTQTTPSRAKAVPSYSSTEPEPFMNEPPWIHTRTGRPPSRGIGAQMFRFRQSSPEMTLLGEQSRVLRRIVALGHGRAVLGGGSHTIPRHYRRR